MRKGHSPVGKGPEGVGGGYVVTRWTEAAGSSETDAKAATLGTLAAEEKTAEAKMFEEVEEARAATEHLREIAKPQREKARKEDQEANDKKN